MKDGQPGIGRRVIDASLDRCDIASSVFFRVAFGGVMAYWCWDYLSRGRVRDLFIQPEFHFTYYGFDWVQPWSGEGMIIHFLVLLVLSVCVAVGFFYRMAGLLLAIGFTYVFLLDRTNYQNHYYLIALIAWWMPLLPLHRAASVDAHLRPALRDDTLPNWCLWVLRFHVGLPYVFGGIAKFQPDWLLGRPMDQMLASQSSLPLVGPWLAEASMGLVFAWGGLLFDLLIVPALLYRRTRWWAYALCIGFHLTNSVLFNIHIFPWFMIAGSTIFFPPSWPRSALAGQPLSIPPTPTASAMTVRRQSLWVGFMVAYVLFHMIWPLRHYLQEGDTGWHERGHYFAWRMMLRGKPVVLGYAIKDRVTGKVVDGQVDRYLCAAQRDRFARDPEMILHLAHFLGTRYEQETGNAASVYVLALASLNGRKPELFLDPNVDLMREPRGWHSRSWVMPQKEPLREVPWTEPISEWRSTVELPELDFLRQEGEVEGRR